MESTGRQSAAYLLVQRPQLQAREVGAQADVRAVAEGDVGVGGAGEVQGEGGGEDAFVVVGGGVEDDHLVVGADAGARQLRVLGGRAAEGEDRGVAAEEFVHGRREPHLAVAQAAVGLGVLRQEVQAAGGCAAYGVVAA